MLHLIVSAQIQMLGSQNLLHGAFGIKDSVKFISIFQFMLKFIIIIIRAKAHFSGHHKPQPEGWG